MDVVDGFAGVKYILIYKKKKLLQAVLLVLMYILLI